MKMCSSNFLMWAALQKHYGAAPALLGRDSPIYLSGFVARRIPDAPAAARRGGTWKIVCNVNAGNV